MTCILVYFSKSLDESIQFRKSLYNLTQIHTFRELCLDIIPTDIYDDIVYIYTSVLLLSV